MELSSLQTRTTRDFLGLGVLSPKSERVITQVEVGSCPSLFYQVCRYGRSILDLIIVVNVVLFTQMEPKGGVFYPGFTTTCMRKVKTPKSSCLLNCPP